MTVSDGPPHTLPLPLRLWALHRSLPVGAGVVVTGSVPWAVSLRSERTHAAVDEPLQWFLDVVAGAGFEVEGTTVERTGDRLTGSAVRARTLADTVGPGMRLLVCGLNPSLVAADAGVGFAGPTNRFWKAAVAAGAVSTARDPRRALDVDRMGMTDLVKRATRSAAEVQTAEYRSGLDRLDRLATWLEPRAICFVGLAGWRAGGHPGARAGRQPDAVGGRPVYVMPSTSGLNAHSTLADLTGHLAAALELADAG